MKTQYRVSPQQLRISYQIDSKRLNITQPNSNSQFFTSFYQNQFQKKSERHKNIQCAIKNMRTKIQGIQNITKEKKWQISQLAKYSPTEISNEQFKKSTNNFKLPYEMKQIDFRGSCPIGIANKHQQLGLTVSTNLNSLIVEKVNQLSNKINTQKQKSIFKKKFFQNPTNNYKCHKVTSSSPLIQLPKLIYNSSINQMTPKRKDRLPSPKQSKQIFGFQFGKSLGKGKFGEVFLAKHLETGFIVAIKKIYKAKVIEQKMLEQLKNEINLHSSLNHPNIVKLYGVFHDNQSVYLVIQYMNGGTLFDYMNSKDCLSVKQTLIFLRDVIQAIKYLHQNSIAHRDIKPENIVLSSEGVAKICDFGWSAYVKNCRKTFCGTFDYAPPQILERKTYDKSVDIWCIGVLTYQLLTGRVPFQEDQRKERVQKIINVDKNKISYPSYIPEEAKKFIALLVQKNPQERPKCKDLLQHPFIKQQSLTNHLFKK